MTEVARADMFVGRKYRVEWSDCCVSGSFVGVLTGKPEDPDGYEPFVFDVGTIESWGWTATEASP